MPPPLRTRSRTMRRSAAIRGRAALARLRNVIGRVSRPVARPAPRKGSRSSAAACSSRSSNATSSAGATCGAGVRRSLPAQHQEFPPECRDSDYEKRSRPLIRSTRRSSTGSTRISALRTCRGCPILVSLSRPCRTVWRCSCGRRSRLPMPTAMTKLPGATGDCGAVGALM